MATEGEEVAIQVLYVYFYMGSALGSIYQDGDAAFVGYLYQGLYGVDGAQHVAHVGDAE